MLQSPKTTRISLLLLAGVAMAFAGCAFKNPTDPLGGGGTTGQTTRVNVNQSDHHTTAISAAATQANHQGVYISVVDQDGNPIKAAAFAGANFNVKYKGSVVPGGSLRVGTASSAGQSISSSLVLDYSGSMSGNITDLETAATGFVNNMQAADRGEIVKFDTNVVVEQPYTTDKSALLTGVTKDDASFGGVTALYDAIYKGLQDTAPETGQRAVVAFTDGGENASTIITSLSDLINQARNRGIPVFTIGLGGADTITLQSISQQTNGRFYLAPTAAQLTTIYQQISQTFTNTMIISWSSFTYSSGATVTVTITYACATGTYTSTATIILP